MSPVIVNSLCYSVDGDTFDTFQVDGFSHETWSLYSYREVE